MLTVTSFPPLSVCCWNNRSEIYLQGDRIFGALLAALPLLRELGHAGAVLRQTTVMRSPWRRTKNIISTIRVWSFQTISSSGILHLLTDSYYISLQLSKMREKVLAVNNSTQYLNTLHFGRVYALPLLSCFLLASV